MAQISSGNGFKAVVPQPKGVVGKEEALRMEEEALAKLQRGKRPTLSAPTSSSSSLKPSKATAPQPLAATDRPERDLIVFPETRKQPEPDKFSDIDVDKLTNEELEKLLLDENFGVNIKVSRPSSLLGFNLSASYPGGSSPFHTGQWTPALSTPSNTRPGPLFPSAPGTFQNGFPPLMPPFMALAATQPSFMSFAPIRPAAAAAMVFPQPSVDPEMAKLFDKIASTSEYLKNGKSAGAADYLDSSQAGAVSLAPNPPAAAEPASVSRFDWLDLDPLTKHKAENEDVSLASGAAIAAPAAPEVAGDPWDAVLETEGIISSSSSPPPTPEEATARSQHRRASTGAAVTRSHSLNIKPNHQVGRQSNVDHLGEILSSLFTFALKMRKVMF